MRTMNEARRTRASLVAVYTLAGALASIALPRGVVAQGSVSAVALDNFAPPSQSGAIPGCGSATPTSGVASYSCGPLPVTGGIYSGTGFASALAGQLRASTTASAVLAGNGSVSSIAQSWWTDQAAVTVPGTPSAPPPVASALQIALHVTGTLSGVGADLSGYQGSSAMAVVRLPYDTPIGRSYIQYQFTAGPGNQTSPTYAPSVDQVFLVTLALANNGTSTFTSGAFTYGITTFTDLSSSVADLANPTLTGSADADFAHTVDPLWYHVLDATGTDVTSAYAVRFAQGLTFGAAPPSITPEPTAVALVGTGLLALVPAARRRRRT